MPNVLLTSGLDVVDVDTNTVLDGLLEFSRGELATFAYMWLCSRRDIVFRLKTTIVHGEHGGRKVVDDAEVSPYSKLAFILPQDVPFSRNYLIQLIRDYRLLDCGVLTQ